MTAAKWTRLEPFGTVAPREGALARLADPLWLVGRQWQLGELTAEDAGSPVTVRVTSVAHAVDRIRIGDREVSWRGEPIEAIVEREPHREPDLRTRLRAGQLLLARLHHSGFDAAAVLARDLFSASGTDPLVALSSTIDAAKVVAHLASDATGASLAALLSPTRREELAALVVDWYAWFRPQRELPSAWDSQRCEYRFTASVPLGDLAVELVASDYRGGQLDWEAFDASVVQLSTPAPPPTRRTATLLAAAVTFPTMPVARFWELEDGTLDLAGIDADLDDVGTLLVTEFALAGSDDWIVLPVDVPNGSLVTLEEVTVRCTFGTQTTHARLLDPRWRMFELTGDPRVAPYLLAWPTQAGSLDGPALEEVCIGRDENANLAWAIEHILVDSLGRARAKSIPAPPVIAPPGDGDRTSFVLAHPPPERWFPLIDRERLLRAATLLVDRPIASPAGAILSDWPATRISSDEVPRAGVVITRAWQLATDVNGRRFTWITRRKLPGARDLTSRLRFDTLSDES